MKMNPSERASTLIIMVVGLAALTGCGMPYIGSRLATPERRIAVLSPEGEPMSGYDLYVYRCTHPGSSFDRAFPFPAQTQSTFSLARKSESAVKRFGVRWLGPDFLASYEKEPYWVACVNKPGYQSRRWSLDDSQGDPVKILMRPGPEPGPDRCGVEAGECDPCRSYEYALHGDRRYRHGACAKRE